MRSLCLKLLFTLSYLLPVLILLMSCSSSNDESPMPSGPVPVITGFSPDKAQVGAQIKIIGSNLGTSQTSQVYFTGAGNTKIPVEINGRGSLGEEAWLYVNVPEGAVTGAITVINDGVSSAGDQLFDVAIPEQNLSVYPSSGSPGTTVILQGIPFEGDLQSYDITFPTANGRSFAIISRISAEGQFALVFIPSYAVSGQIHVEYNGDFFSTTTAFEVVDCNVNTFAGGADGYVDATGIDAKFDFPSGMVVAGGLLYIADQGNQKIRIADVATGVVTTLVGSDYGYVDGSFSEAKFNSPVDITVGKDGDLYVADSWNHSIRKINLETQQVTTVAGTGATGQQDGSTGTSVLRLPTGITTAADGMIYFTETSDSHRIKRLDPNTNEVTTIAGTGTAGYLDGAGLSAAFFEPTDLVEVDGFLYITDQGNGVIRRLNLSDFTVTTFAGGGDYDMESTGGVGEYSSFNNISGIDTDGEALFVTDLNLVRRIDIASKAVTRAAGYNTISFEPKNGSCSEAEFEGLQGITVSEAGGIYVSDMTGFSVDKSLIRVIDR